jgi:hypothetical protein
VSEVHPELPPSRELGVEMIEPGVLLYFRELEPVGEDLSGGVFLLVLEEDGDAVTIDREDLSEPECRMPDQ